MSVANPRTRLISFRLSERDYARLQRLCTSQGARSLADFVRASVCWAMDHNDQRAMQASGQPSPRPSLAEADAPTAALTPSADRTHASMETLASLLLGVQWRVESLDRGVQDLVALLRERSEIRARTDGSVPDWQ